MQEERRAEEQKSRRAEQVNAGKCWEADKHDYLSLRSAIEWVQYMYEHLNNAESISRFDYDYSSDG